MLHGPKTFTWTKVLNKAIGVIKRCNSTLHWQKEGNAGHNAVYSAVGHTKGAAFQ